MRRRIRLRARSGMTLMELSVTLLITGLMTAAGAAAFTGIIRHNQVLNNANVATERAEALRDQIRTWVTAGTIQMQQGGAPGGANARGGAVTVRANPNAPVGVTAAVATGDELTFTTSALTPANAPSTRIRLFVDGDESTPEYGGLTIEYQGSTNTPLQRRLLDPTIQAMKVEFLDSRTHQWMEASPGATTVATTPTAARLTFLPYDSTNANDRLVPLLSVPFIFRIGNPVAATTTPGG